jgi:putative spermidine/putrescine transport system permease protein
VTQDAAGGRGTSSAPAAWGSAKPWHIPEGAWGLLLLAPALALLAALFAYPLALSIIGAFTDKAGNLSGTNYRKIFELYTGDIVFSGAVSCFTVVVTDIFAVVIGGYLTLGGSPKTVAALRWLYRWPLFIPFVVAAQMMRGFLAKNGLMNNSLVTLGLIEPANTVGLLDWRGVVITFVWKQLPFVTLLVSGAMAALDRSMIEAARNLGAGRLRVLLEIMLPQVRGSLLVASVLTFVTLMSVLSVPMMINAAQPTMITVDMAYRITSLSDYGAANALGVVSYLMTAILAWLYLSRGMPRIEKQ